MKVSVTTIMNIVLSSVAIIVSGALFAMLMQHHEIPPTGQAWGVVEARSGDGLYGVEALSSLCVAQFSDRIPNETHIVAAFNGKLPLPVVGDGVFMTHDHYTGKWTITKVATDMIVRNAFGQALPMPPMSIDAELRTAPKTAPKVDEKANPAPKELEELPVPPREDRHT